MSLRVELGALSVQVDHQEEAAAFLRSLARHLTNREVSEVLGVTDKTVRRWRREGRLPGGAARQLTLLELLQHLGFTAPVVGAAEAGQTPTFLDEESPSAGRMVQPGEAESETGVRSAADGRSDGDFECC